jgi:pimeloyl-ACP methyl ester carboxylesterase
VPARSAWIDLADGRLEVLSVGPPPGTALTLVLLHEGLGSAGLWRGLPDALAAATGFGVLAYSRFGYGRSDPVSLPRPLDYMRREACDVLPRVLDASGVRRSVLIGHSDGGSIATIHAGTCPHLSVLGLVLIAPHFFVEDLTLDSIAAIRDEYDNGGLRARLAHHHAEPDLAFHGWAGAWLDPKFKVSFDLREPLERIRVPMLILQGDADPYGTLAHARLAECTAPGPVRTVVLAARHAPHLEVPLASVSAISCFVASL